MDFFTVSGRHLRCSTRITVATSIRRYKKFCFICNQIWFSVLACILRWQRLGIKHWSRLGSLKCPCTQCRQSAKLFLQSIELRLPTSSPARRVCPPPLPLVPEEGHIRLRERGYSGVTIRTRRQTLWYSRYICTLWSCRFSCSGRINYSPGFQSGSSLSCSIQIKSHMTYFPAKIQPSTQVSDTCCLQTMTLMTQNHWGHFQVKVDSKMSEITIHDISWRFFL